MKRLLALWLALFLVGCASLSQKSVVKETSPAGQPKGSVQAGTAQGSADFITEETATAERPQVIEAPAGTPPTPWTEIRYPLADARGFTLTEPKGESPVATGTLRLAGHFNDARWMKTLSVVLFGPDGKESRAGYFLVDANGNFGGELRLGTISGMYQVQIHAPQLFEMSPLNVATGLVMTFSVENRAATSGQPGVRAEKALEIAAKLHDPRDHLLVRFDPTFEYESKGESAVRPVWTVQTLSPAPYVKVYVDAETGGHFRVLQSEAPSPKPEDQGFISLEKAIESGTRGENTSTLELGRGAILQYFPVDGKIEFAVWRLELVSKDDRRPQSIILVDAKTGEVVSVSHPPTGD